RLSRAVAGIKARAGKLEAPRLLLWAGAILIPLGLGLIGVAWYGAAHTPFLFEQIPYMISGGLLGLGLAFVGGFLYFAFWLTRLLQDTRAQGARQAEALEQIRTLLADGMWARGAGSEVSGSNGEYVVTQKGSMFHRADCRLVAGRKDLRRVSSVSDLEPCKVCDPLAIP
ncbi:MAG: hypothetical protein ACRDJP_13765, partial [Actinomycetota bacterium]